MKGKKMKNQTNEREMNIKNRNERIVTDESEHGLSSKTFDKKEHLTTQIRVLCQCLSQLLPLC